jgi:hypothetical protein
MEAMDQQTYPRARAAGDSVPGYRAPWQREFFDHVLRSSESYAEKWNYVRDNPVRAGLATVADEWKHAGELERLML